MNSMIIRARKCGGAGPGTTGAKNVSASKALPVLLLLAVSLSAGVGLAQDASLLQPQQQFEAARARGDLAAALTFGQQALELAEQRYGESSPDIVGLLELLGRVHAQAGNFPDAIGHYQSAVEILEREFGSDHPELIATLDAMVDVRIQQQNYAAAESLLDRILAIEKLAYGETHGNVVITMQRLREVYLLDERPADAARIDAALEKLDTFTRGGDLMPPDPTSLDQRRYSAAGGFATVKVFYGTNRARSGIEKAPQFYGPERGELEFGHLDVNIPAIHKYGDLETAPRWSIFSYDVGEDAVKKKYVLLLGVEPLDEQDFRAQLRKHVQASPSNDVFLFVHGYNASFEDTARRTAQLAYDLDFDGTPMMYSWPSQASATSYTVDEAVVRLSGRKMARFMNEVVEHAGADRIHLIAHSMGNRAMIEALSIFAAAQEPAKPAEVFDQIVFTAPDVDRDYFIDIVESIRGLANRVTLYASENDVALQSSAILHGAPRAGLAGENTVTLPGLDTIDMSAVEADRLGHSYFAVDEGPIYDLFRLLWRGEPPQRRCGKHEQAADEARIWQFDVETCGGGEVLEAGLLLKRFGGDARDKVQDHLGDMPQDADAGIREEWSRILDRLDKLLESESNQTLIE